MKKSILLACLIPLVSFAAQGQDNAHLAMYQELCAKEQDPLKRQSYCHMLERSAQTEATTNVFRQDIAIV